MDQQNNQHSTTGLTDRPLVILGCGYTGRHIMQLTLERGTSAWATSRNPALQLATVPFPQRLEFNLARPKTWEHLPTGADLIWCFPTTPLEQVQAFARSLDATPRRIVVLGSTSAYDTASQSTEYPPAWIDESAPIDLTKPRVKGEEFLRKEYGAIVLRVAGIYGPGRNPLDWIRQGRIVSSRKYVNLIHVEDLALICFAALKHGTPGQAYNVSDGTPKTWEDISSTAKRRWGIESMTETGSTASGKRLSNGKVLTMLRTSHDDLRHSDFFKALEQIENSALTS